MSWGAIDRVTAAVAIVADPDPNTTAPTRTFITRPSRSVARISLKDGTSLTATAWAYEKQAARWIQILTVAGVTPAVPQNVSLAVGALTFIQYSSIVGSITEILAVPVAPSKIDVLAFAHVHDDGSGPVVIASGSIASVTKSATGVYNITPVSSVDASQCHVAPTYLSNADGDIGLCFCNNTLTQTLQITRYDLSGGPEDGPFTVDFVGNQV